MQDTSYQTPQNVDAHPADQTVLAERIKQASAYRREDDAIDIKWLLDTIYAGRHIMLGAVGLAMLLAMTYLLVATPRFEAASQLLIESRKPRIIAGDEVAPGLDTGRFMLSQVIDSQIQLLRSPRLAERVIKELDLREFAVPKDAGGWPFGWSTKASTESAAPGLGPTMSISATEPMERQVSQSEVESFLRGLDVRRIGLSLIIQVKYVHKDPAQAARIANAVATRYLAIQEEERFAKTENVRRWLKGRVAELQLKIGESRRNIELYKAKNDLVDTGGQLLQERELSETMVQWIAARANASTLLAEVRKVEESADLNSRLQATGLALKSNVISDFKRQHAQVQRQLATTVSRFGATHPQVHTYRAELKNIEREMGREVDRLVKNLRNEYEVSNTKAELLRQRVEVLKANLSKSRKLKIELAEMERAAKVESDLFAGLLSRLRETELQQSLKQADASIVQLARAPLKPTHPRKTIVMLGGILAALALSGTYVMFTEFFGNFLRTPTAVRRYLGFKTVVPVPMVRLRNATTMPDGDAEPLVLRLLRSSSSAFVQQIFVLKETIRKVRRSNEGQVVAVISSSEKEGKTTTSVALAQYVADAGRKTLLIDCDMHKADATRILHPRSEKHLQDIVDESVDDPSFVIGTLASGLDICPARLDLSGPRPMDVLASRQMAELIKSVRKNYDLVVIDTPALANYVDARALVGAVDHILLVVEADKSTVTKVNDALEPVEEHRAKIESVVFNKARVLPTVRDLSIIPDWVQQWLPTR